MRMMSCRSPSCRRRILVLFLLLLPNLGQASVESHPVDLSMQSYLDLLLSSPDSLPSPPEVPFRSSAQFIFDHHLPSSPLSSSLSSSSASFDASMKFDRTRTRKRKSRLPASLSQAINRGLRLAVQECKHQFQSAQWNCPTMKHLKGKAMFGQLLNQPYRESGFVFAIRSAGITFAITKACADGLIRNCGCQSHCSTISTVRPELPIQSQSPSASIDAFASSSSFSFSSSSSPSLSPSPTAVHSAKPESSWPSIGCSDNIEYASSQTKQLLDVRLKSEPTDLSTVLMTHNYNAGRQAVVQNMRTVCKCHGISGSCSVRSCWRRLSSFRQIGDWLKTRYDEAIRVQPANDGINYTAIEHQDSNSRSSPWPQSADIVFADTSPNFCLPDPRIGSVGTRTRRCKPNSSQPDNCDLLCCGRGYETVQHTQRYNCRCQFQWCCDVQCDQCERQVDVHICR